MLEVEYDRERFELGHTPPTIESGGWLRLQLKYAGEDSSKDLQSQIVAHVEGSDGPTQLVIPVLYNYLSAAARNLLGLSEQEAEQLLPGKIPAPVLQPQKETESPRNKPLEDQARPDSRFREGHNARPSPKVVGLWKLQRPGWSERPDSVHLSHEVSCL